MTYSLFIDDERFPIGHDWTIARSTEAAQKIILDRMVGKRLPGSNPAAQGGIAVSFVDLTKAAIGGETDAGDGEDTQVP